MYFYLDQNWTSKIIWWVQCGMQEISILVPINCIWVRHSDEPMYHALLTKHFSFHFGHSHLQHIPWLPLFNIANLWAVLGFSNGIHQHHPSSPKDVDLEANFFEVMSLGIMYNEVNSCYQIVQAPEMPCHQIFGEPWGPTRKPVTWTSEGIRLCLHILCKTNLDHTKIYKSRGDAYGESTNLRMTEAMMKRPEVFFNIVARSRSEGHWPRIDCLRHAAISSKWALSNDLMSESTMTDSMWQLLGL